MYIERDVHMKLKKFIAPLLVGVLAFAIAGCGTNTNQSSQTPKELKSVLPLVLTLKLLKPLQKRLKNKVSTLKL